MVDQWFIGPHGEPIQNQQTQKKEILRFTPIDNFHISEKEELNFPKDSRTLGRNV